MSGTGALTPECSEQVHTHLVKPIPTMPQTPAKATRPATMAKQLTTEACTEVKLLKVVNSHETNADTMPSKPDLCDAAQGTTNRKPVKPDPMPQHQSGRNKVMCWSVDGSASVGECERECEHTQ